MNAASRRCDRGRGRFSVRFRLGLMALLVGMAVPGFSPVAAELYTATVTVPSEARQERERAARLGLLQVLVRLTAEPGIIREPGVVAMLDNPLGYLQQFVYRADPDGAGRQLELRYDRTAVVQGLQEAGLPVWLEADRPRLMVWLVVDEGNTRTLVGGDVRPEVQAELRAAAEQDGVDVLVPLLDLLDRRLVRSFDVWGVLRQPILNAAQRYRTDTILVGRVVVREGRQLQGRWTLFHPSGDLEEWSASAGTRYAIIRSGVRGAAQRLATRLARLPGDRILGEVRMDVFGVADLADLAAVYRQLAIARGVHRFDVAEADDDRLSLRLQLEGGIEQLVADLERSGRFQRPADGVDGAALPASRPGAISLQLLP